jgi:hypothetical protein
LLVFVLPAAAMKRWPAACAPGTRAKGGGHKVGQSGGRCAATCRWSAAGLCGAGRRGKRDGQCGGRVAMGAPVGQCNLI